VGLVAAQFYYAQDPDNELSLANLNKRVPELRQATDPVDRDMLCIPLAADARALDNLLRPDARVFLTGMIGRTNGLALGYYYFMRNYLFPRDVEISLGDKAVFHDGWFDGVPCTSTNLLRANGFDLMIGYTNNHMHLVTLTPKGAPLSQ